MTREEKETIQEITITKEVIIEAEKIIGLTFTDDERELMVKRLNRRLDSYKELRTLKLDNSLPPALCFDPRLPGMTYTKNSEKKSKQRTFKMSKIPMPPVPSNLGKLAFYPVTHLSQLIQTRQVTSVALTEM